MTDLPAPLIDSDVDLRDFAYMPLDVLRLRDSEIAAIENAEAFRAAVLAWCAAWHQVPAGSLPDDDRVLSRLLGFGGNLKKFQKIRSNGALHKFIKCSDGRLYHPVVCDKAREAWKLKLSQKDRTKRAREAKTRAAQTSQPIEEERNHRYVTGDVTDDKRQHLTVSKKPPDTDPVTESVTTDTKPIVTGSNRIEWNRSIRDKIPSSDLIAARLPVSDVETTTVVDCFLGCRERGWPGDPRLPAPSMTLTATARRWLAAGGTVELCTDHVRRKMDQAAARGQSPPTSLEFCDRSMMDAIAALAAKRHDPEPERAGDRVKRHLDETDEFYDRIGVRY